MHQMLIVQYVYMQSLAWHCSLDLFQAVCWVQSGTWACMTLCRAGSVRKQGLLHLLTRQPQSPARPCRITQGLQQKLSCHHSMAVARVHLSVCQLFGVPPAPPSPPTPNPVNLSGPLSNQQTIQLHFSSLTPKPYAHFLIPARCVCVGGGCWRDVISYLS